MHNADVSVCNADIRVCVWPGRNTSAVVVTCSDTGLTALRADVSRSDSPQPSSSLHPGRVCVCDCAHYTIISVHILFVCVRHCASLNNPSVTPDETDGKSSTHTHTHTFSLLLLPRVVVYWFRWSVLLPLCILELIILELLPLASLSKQSEVPKPNVDSILGKSPHTDFILSNWSDYISSKHSIQVLISIQHLTSLR